MPAALLMGWGRQYLGFYMEVQAPLEKLFLTTVTLSTQAHSERTFPIRDCIAVCGTSV